MAGRSEAGGRGVVAALLAVLLGGCGASTSATNTPPPTPLEIRATPSSPTQSLPIAKAVVGTPTALEVTPGTNSATAVAVSQTLVLRSTAFTSGGAMPGDYTCDGAGQSPPLTWSGAPFGTRAYALVAEDADAQSGSEPFTQWIVYNMPANVMSLNVGVVARPLLPNGAQQGLNSGQTIGYESPCPNRGDTPHHYNFQLFAQDDFITLETGATPDEVRTALNGHVIGQALLVATLQR